LNAAVVADAFELERDFSLQWWDCLIVASALAANCAYVLSEDMQHGQIIRSAQVLNPFLSSPAELTTRR
jgi:predicted nucleic acid-binding protein